jgi:hypothetical protein
MRKETGERPQERQRGRDSEIYRIGRERGKKGRGERNRERETERE